MASTFFSLPAVQDFFPPTRGAYSLLYNVFKYVGLAGLITTTFPSLQAMGRTSTSSRFNLPGRYAWSAAESVGPLYLSYIIWTLPSSMVPAPHSSTSFLGTGLPSWSEILYLLYLVHYLNRAFITPLFLSPSMSPIHASVVVAMAIFQFVNAGSIGSWLVYSSVDNPILDTSSPSLSLTSMILPLAGLNLYTIGLFINFNSEQTLFRLRRAAAARRAKSEGKPFITYDKIYVIPPTSILWFKYILYPHYVGEWLEWLGFWLVGIGAGLASAVSSSNNNSLWRTPAFWFLVNEVLTMIPRARDGRRWYEDRFGKRAVAGRGGVSPFAWL